MLQENGKYVADAQDGLKRIENAILGLLSDVPDGLTNSTIAAELGLKTSGIKGQKNYLTWSILQEMVRSEILSLQASPRRRREILYTIKPTC